MTGVGFGCCAIALVKEKGYDQFVRKFGKIYEDKIGYQASFYKANIDDSARKIEN